MKQVVLASHNRKKIAELRTLLSAYCPDVEVLSLSDIGFSGDIEETGTTFEENAKIKASVPAKMGYIGIADDSGISVTALGGAPGVYSARYSGPDANDERNNDKLLSSLADKEDRSAKYVCVMACVFPDGDEREDFTVRGECHGYITAKRYGTGGFGYDPLFYYPPFGMTFGEADIEDKNRVSHRANAISVFAEKLGKIL